MVDKAKCYELLGEVPEGKVTTYKELARALGTRGYRAIGVLMNKNPFDLPCHRVIKSNGEIGGYAYGVEKKKELLLSEGILIKGDRVRDLDKFFFYFG